MRLLKTWTVLLLTTLLPGLPLAAVECKALVTLVPNVGDRCNSVPAERSMPLPGVSTVARMQNFHVHLFFRDPAVKDGKMQIALRILLRDAAGNIAFDSRDSIKTLSGKAPQPGKQALHPAGCRIALGRDKTPGEYTVETEVTDLISKQTVRDTVRITLQSEPEHGKGFQSRREVMQFMQNYYQRPEPGRIIPALQYWQTALPELQKTGRGRLPVLFSWFYFALKPNPQLWKAFAAEASRMDGESRKMAALVVSALSGKRSREFFELDKVSALWQLDILWNEFYAAGARKPVELLCQQIKRLPQGMRPEDFKLLKDPSAGDRGRLLDNLTGRAALWSIRSNAMRHALVTGYLEKMLQSKKIQDSFTVESVLRIVRPDLPDPIMRPAKPEAGEK